MTNHHEKPRLPPNATPFQKFKYYGRKTISWTLGNRRLKMYLYSVLKFFSITYVQANDLLGKNPVKKTELQENIESVTRIISYVFMALILLSFTERYIRELIAVYRKRKLSIVINWGEAILFLIYFIYSIFTSIIHIYFIVKEYEHEKEEEAHDTSGIEKHLEQNLAIEIFEVFLHLYIIIDKGTHYLHSGHSVSLYLSKSQHIPKPHGSEHSVYGDTVSGQLDDSRRVQLSEQLLEENTTGFEKIGDDDSHFNKL
ncbi:hypothetical protein ABK040_006057 [Willaertia magna]